MRGYLVWSGGFLFGLLDDFLRLLPCGVTQLKPFLWAENVIHHRHGFVLVPMGGSPENWGRCHCANPSVGCGLELQKGVRSHIHSDWKKVFPRGCAFRRNCRNALWAPLISLSLMYAAQSCSVYGERGLANTALRSACSRGLISDSFFRCRTNRVISLSIMSALATGAHEDAPWTIWSYAV